MTSKDQENARMVASLLGLQDDEAMAKLDVPIQVVWDDADNSAACLGNFVCELLRRTFRIVGNPHAVTEDASVILLINSAASDSRSKSTLYCNIGNVFYCGANKPVGEFEKYATPEILCLLAACFCAAQVTYHALQLTDGRVSGSGVAIDFADWPGVSSDVWAQELDLGSMQFAGAGAVGNAALFALQHLPVRIQGVLIDPKKVASGILNRCLYFDEADVGKDKAVALVDKLRKNQHKISLTPVVGTVSQARRLQANFNCLVVGIDSRLGRRQLQEELPLEVYDASTTGIDEVVFHHSHLQGDGACLACVYKETEAERDFAAHVAETLNVSADDVREEFISIAAAIKICERYPELNCAELTGKAYTTIFRQQCATGTLKTPEEKQILAPFAFVSLLAGTVLAIEIFLRRSLPSRSSSFNYWRVNPWRGVSSELQALKQRNPDCAVCGQPAYQHVAQQVWNKAYSPPSKLEIVES